MNPVAFRIPLPFLNTSLDFTWYGISIVIGVLVAANYAAWAAKRRGQDPNNVWDMFIYILVFGVISARIWYVITATLGGNLYYMQNPIQILNIRAGGTNIFGAIMGGILTVFIFCKAKKLNPLMYLDFVGPSVLLGQGVSRWGNFVNQELYGPPTTLPWGIAIDALHRIAPFNDLSRFPLSTRFHPTFLYETIYDLIAFAILFYLFRRFERWWKVGAAFGAYLMVHGTGRFFIEFFRPDQPRIGTTDLSYSRGLAILFVLIGAGIVYISRRRPETLAPAAAEATIAAEVASDTAPAETASVAGEEVTTTEAGEPEEAAAPEEPA
jgi:phosphatidylglycerol---prolipoprotein diacylglyceryl transferase